MARFLGQVFQRPGLLGNWFIVCIVWASLLTNTQCLADEIVLDGGLGAFSTEGQSLSQVKFAKIGIEEDLWDALHQRFNTGAWLDSRTGKSNSGFLGYQLGFEVSNGEFEASVWAGPSGISSTDTSLGSNFQFNETLFFGISDKHHNTIGLSYNHFSCASLCYPNLGKDFAGISIKFPY